MAGIMQLAAGSWAAAGPAAPVVPPANSIDVANLNESGFAYYGAYNYTTGYINFGISNFGTIRSDYFYAVMFKGDGFGTSETIIALNPGSYTGFTVTNGAIDGDVQTYPRVFTIGGSNYTFNYNGNGLYLASDDPLNLIGSDGSTVTAVYNPAIQPSLTPNSIIVGQYSSGPNTYYGASKEIAPGYGTVVSDYLTEVAFVSLTTYIALAAGTYTGFTVDSDGLIDGDNSTARTFTVNSINAAFTVTGSAPNYVYTNMGNPFNLNTNVGNTLTAIYDPNVQPVPVPGEFAAGNMTVGSTNIFGTDYWGWDSFAPTPYGSGTVPTPPSGPTMRIFYSPDPPGPSSTPSTTIGFQSGTYGNTVVVNSPTATIDDETQVTVTIDGVTQVGTLESSGSGPQLVFSGDVFSLQSKNTQTLAVTMIAGIVVPPSNEVASGDITVGNDTVLYGYAQGGLSFGSSTIDPAMVRQLYWASFGGFTKIQLIGGTYGNVVVDASAGTVDGETQLTVVVDSISRTGTLTTSGPYVEIQSIPGDPYGLQSKDGQTLTVSVIAGGGGGTTYTSSGNWNSSSFGDFGMGWRVFLGLAGPGTNAGLVSALNALTVGSTFSITDNSSTTQSVTVSSISGQPFSESSFVTIYVNTPSPPPAFNWPSVASITI